MNEKVKETRAWMEMNEKVKLTRVWMEGRRKRLKDTSRAS